MSGFDLETYARLRAELAREGVDRETVLASHGLDEDGWDVIDDRFQAQLSQALDQPGDDVPAEVLRYAEAFADAQRTGPGPLLSLQQFAACTRAVQHARDPRLALSKLGTTLTAFLKANHHWSPQLAHDPALAERFQLAMRASRPQVLGPDDPLHEGWIEGD
jgi:hypothetical protein